MADQRRDDSSGRDWPRLTMTVLCLLCVAGAILALVWQKWAAACCFTLAVGLWTVVLTGSRPGDRARGDGEAGLQDGKRKRGPGAIRTPSGGGRGCSR